MIGKKLKINLSNHTWSQEEIPSEWVLNYGGGTGLALEAFFGTPASSSCDTIIVAPGLMAGTNAPAGHWSSVLYYDPTTENALISYFGGHWGSSLRFCDIGLLEIEGQASSMTVLVIENGQVHFLKANDLEGKTPLETVRRLEDTLGNEYRIASIGLAGEMGIPLASLVFDGTYQRQSPGLGARLGRMRVKAIAVKGTGKVIPQYPQAFYREARRLRDGFSQEHFPIRELYSYGSVWFIKNLYERAMLPVKNFTTSLFPEVERLTGESFADCFKRQPIACSGCPVGCRWTALMNGNCFGGPELEETIALGPLCGIPDQKVILQMKAWCDRFGIDPLALGALIASVMDLSESKTGESFVFGEGEKILRILEGEKNPAEALVRLGILSDRMEKKLLRNSSWVGFMSTDPRADLPLALHRITWPFNEPPLLGSAVFLDRLPIYSGLGNELGISKAVSLYQDFNLGLQSLGFCPWTSLIFAPADLDPLIRLGLGDGYPDQATSQLGRTILSGLERLQPNLLRSNSPDMDQFGKLAKEPIADGARKGQKLDLADPWQDYLKIKDHNRQMPISFERNT